MEVHVKPSFAKDAPPITDWLGDELRRFIAGKVGCDVRVHITMPAARGTTVDDAQTTVDDAETTVDDAETAADGESVHTATQRMGKFEADAERCHSGDGMA
ncbi:hypothetical protein [Alicyclobacillus sp. ALC3]|uniref:hypothetical protein n=1 Tax=Alicyclobacillus sp. ALC3 TaxID=2796143 RepID=UPI002378F706|nr:hypothetical protein [Alicyclobacillus sp. ALC3]WDL98646.1 hypothetical protein JC200_08270 [Alicyclobacillus sp. ALC3]